MMVTIKQPKFFRGKPIIKPGETYEIDGILYKVITATSSIVDDQRDNLKITELIYWLDNVKTNERSYMSESELESKFKEDIKEVVFTKEEREAWIVFCEKVAEELGIEHGDFNKLTDSDLDKTSDWYFELTLK